MNKEERRILAEEKKQRQIANKEMRAIEREGKKNQKAEEKIRKQIERENRRAAKSIPFKEKKPKQEASESELVRRYVNRTIKNSEYHGRSTLQGRETKTGANKNLWQDNEFYFSVVFQSLEQKLEFLEKFLPASVDPELSHRGTIQIVNGLKLAEALGITLKLETRRDYPTADIDLKPFVLDTETL